MQLDEAVSFEFSFGAAAPPGIALPSSAEEVE
jgi:hypothetical protein